MSELQFSVHYSHYRNFKSETVPVVSPCDNQPSRLFSVLRNVLLIHLMILLELALHATI